MKALAIIPARGGSKGIKNKNIKELDGKPLLAYAIACAKESEKLNHYLVSTDDPAIARVAREYGATVQDRPTHLAGDTAPVTEVVGFIVQELKKTGAYFDLIILLQPTSPLRLGSDVDNVIGMFEDDPEVEGVISVVPMNEVHPARMYRLEGDGWMHSLEPALETSPRQTLAPVYFRNGCIYAVRTSAFERTKSLMMEKKKAYVMAGEWQVNIDTPRDWMIAVELMKEWKRVHGN